MLTTEEKIKLNIADIAVAVKKQLKKEFPECKFSVTIERYSGGQALTVALMTAPFEAFEGSIEKQYAQLNKYCFSDYNWEEKRISNTYTISLQAWQMFKKIVEIVDYYNFDKSDIQSDYFHVNFYSHFHIGKWNKSFLKI